MFARKVRLIHLEYLSKYYATSTTRTHVKDYRPRPNVVLPKKSGWIPPRKRGIAAVDRAPTMDFFEDSREDPFPEIQRRYGEENEFDNDSEKLYKNIWPYKKWLWRSDLNLKNRKFDDKKGLEWFNDDENYAVGRAWYPSELRVKVMFIINIYYSRV